MDVVQVSIKLNADCEGGHTYTVEYSTDCVNFISYVNITFSEVGDTKTIALPANYTCIRLVSLNGCGILDSEDDFEQTIGCNTFRIKCVFPLGCLGGYYTDTSLVRRRIPYTPYKKIRIIEDVAIYNCYETDGYICLPPKGICDDAPYVNPTSIQSLTLTFADISDAETLVGNPSLVIDWNTFFDLPTYGNPFTSVTVAGKVVLLNGGSNIILQNGLFENLLEFLEIDDQIGSIIEAESNVFENTGLTTVNLPALVTVENDLFKDCSNLISANLPALVTVGNELFQNCTSLLNISLPSLITGTDDIFDGCNNLISANLPSLVTVGNDLFQNCTSLTTANLPVLTTFDFDLFRNCTSLINISLPSLITGGSDMFDGCTSLTTVDLPLLTAIGDQAFQNCTSLVNISLPSLVTLGGESFANCTSLTTVGLPVCTNLGGTVGDDLVFSGISGNSITLTIPSVLMTINAGNPDGDIQYLQSNNTVTIITVSTTTTTTTVAPTTTTTTTVAPTTTSTTTVAPTTTSTTTVAPTTTSTTTVAPTTTTTLPYAGTCESYSITDDGDELSTVYSYYEHPSGTFITDTVTFGQTKFFQAYSIPGVTIVSGDAFPVFISSCEP